MNDDRGPTDDARRDEEAWEVAEIDRVLAERAVEVGARAPRDLRERVLDAVLGPEPAPADQAERIQVWRRWRSATPPGSPALHTLRGADAEWQSIGIDGIRTKCLSVDDARRTVTMLVEMAPGSAYPPHRHGGPEECYVVAGDLRVGEQVLTTGDFQRADEGSVHGVQATDNGCLLLLVSSKDDELLDPA